MGLPAALKAHRNNDIELAAKHYQRALNQGDHQPVLFQNYGALLRNHGKDDLARKIYEKGLSLHPNHKGIRQNYANIIRHNLPWTSFKIHLELLHEAWKDDLRSQHFLAIVEILEGQGCLAWAYQFCKTAFKVVQVQPSLLICFYRISTDPKNSHLNSSDVQQLCSFIDHYLDSSGPLQKAEYYFALSWVHATRSELIEARKFLGTARSLLQRLDLNSQADIEKAQSLNNKNSWNMACILLSHQEFSDGWIYFDYGLRAEAPGSQRWQRALPKPFTYEQILLWRGESLKNKNLLLLEEQAIGDVMQFMTLIPTLLAEAHHIGVLVNNRLLSIYQRSFKDLIANGSISIWSFDDVLKGRLDHSKYHLQSPIGSICRYRFTDINSYGNTTPILTADNSLSRKLRQTYMSAKGHPRLLVGISWRGGGTGDRIRQKSIDLKQFEQILRIPNVRFVSLQYGDSESVVADWVKRGVDVIHDSSINPLKNMDHWLAQVAACDAVISVANTTIHGSGGLNIPTLCLLSLHSDWRWIKNDSVKKSYWYPSVGIAREKLDSGWRDAVLEARSWLETGVPALKGPYSVSF